MFLCQSIRLIHKLPNIPIFSGVTARFKIDLPNFSKSFGDVFTIWELRTPPEFLALVFPFLSNAGEKLQKPECLFSRKAAKNRKRK